MYYAFPSSSGGRPACRSHVLHAIARPRTYRPVGARGSGGRHTPAQTYAPRSPAARPADRSHVHAHAVAWPRMYMPGREGVWRQAHACTDAPRGGQACVAARASVSTRAAGRPANVLVRYIPDDQLVSYHNMHAPICTRARRVASWTTGARSNTCATRRRRSRPAACRRRTHTRSSRRIHRKRHVRSNACGVHAAESLADARKAASDDRAGCTGAGRRLCTNE